MIVDKCVLGFCGGGGFFVEKSVILCGAGGGFVGDGGGVCTGFTLCLLVLNGFCTGLLNNRFEFYTSVCG